MRGYKIFWCHIKKGKLYLEICKKNPGKIYRGILSLLESGSPEKVCLSGLIVTATNTTKGVNTHLVYCIMFTRESLHVSTYIVYLWVSQLCIQPDWTIYVYLKWCHFFTHFVLIVNLLFLVLLMLSIYTYKMYM